MKIDPNAPIFGWPRSECGPEVVGMTVRLELAARAMQGLMPTLSLSKVSASNNLDRHTPDGIANRALLCADALIAAYNAGEDK